MTGKNAVSDRPPSSELWPVGRTAEALGGTVRTLHHWEAIGLFVPSTRSPSGYRLYTATDLAELERIVLYRRLGFTPGEVTALLDDGADVVALLRRRRAALLCELDETRRVLDALDTTLERHMDDRPIDAAEMRDLFGETYDEHHREAEERWGETDAWRESAARTATYTRADWEEVKAETDELIAAFLDAFRTGLPADSPGAMDAAELHRQHIDRRFYTCSPQMHRALGDLYVSDPRYAATYEESTGAPGLASYVRDAIDANAARQEAADG